jgi:hypothetical protein
VVASGGCTALALSRLYPALKVTAFDLSLSQLEHVERQAFSAFGGHFQQPRKERRTPRPGRPERAGPTRTSARPSHGSVACPFAAEPSRRPSA